MKNGWYKEEQIKNKNIPQDAIEILGHLVSKSGKIITSYYNTSLKHYFKVGSGKGDKPIRISKEEVIEAEMRGRGFQEI